MNSTLQHVFYTVQSSELYGFLLLNAKQQTHHRFFTFSINNNAHSTVAVNPKLKKFVLAETNKM